MEVVTMVTITDNKQAGETAIVGNTTKAHVPMERIVGLSINVPTVGLKVTL